MEKEEDLDLSGLLGSYKQKSDIEDDVIQTEFNTLFTEQQSVYIPMSAEHQEQYGVPSVVQLKVNSFRHKLYINEFSHCGSEQHIILEKLKRSSERDELDICIDSPGGSIDEGIKIIHIMREIFRGRTTTFIDADASSMGAIVFCCGDKRVVYEFSSLMFHNYSSGCYGKGDENKSRVDFDEKRIHNFFKKIILANKFVTEAEYQRLRDGHDMYMDSVEMLERGIATHIVVGDVELDFDQYLEFTSLGVSIDEYFELLEEKIAGEK